MMQDPTFSGLNSMIYAPDYFYDKNAVVDYGIPQLPSFQMPQMEFQPAEFQPVFPDFSVMSCDQLKAEIENLTNTINNTILSYQTNQTYSNALANAQNQYMMKCGLKADVPSGEMPKERVFSDEELNPVQTQVPAAQGNPTFYDDPKATPATDTTNTNTDKKNIQPLIYGGLGILAILIVIKLLGNEKK